MPVMEQIQAEVEQHPLVLFMKGTPQYPMCGYSSRAVQALLAAGAVNLRTINVLEFPEVRANLPRYSNLPSFPQFYMHGELIGGCDIILELLESGELKRIVAEAGQA
ncbi:Glutaredoxin-4 [compost metagenome]|jgi:monothiol glutaredoxin